MNSTNVNILKLLSQGSFSPESLALYVNVEKNSIQKNIVQINEFLKDNSFDCIKVKDSEFSLTLSIKQWENIFSRKDFITSNEISDYLFIKFIHNKFINLEVEKEILDLSRSSIVRYFKDIKKILDSTGTTYTYQSGKGVRITHVSEECKYVFCKKLVKFFINGDFTLKKDSLLASVLVEYNFMKLFEKLYTTLKKAEISSTNFIISFLSTLFVLNKTLGGFDLKVPNLDYSKYKDLKDFISLTMKEYDKSFQEQTFIFMVNIKNNLSFFEKEIGNKGDILISKIKERLNFSKLDSDLETILLRKICISFFKYENKILKVKNIPIDQSDEKLIDILDDILKELNFKLFFHDKISIVSILKKIIIEHNKELVKDVLLLFNEITISDDHYLKDNLKVKAPDINFHIEPAFLYKLNTTLYNHKYNLVLSDESYIYQNIKLLDSYNYLNILNLVNNHILEEVLKGLNL
ncbi:hypothetical protein [Cetobacterium sp. ZOR0034]|uniref:hypothetical protein n=1 Tax=Cetobacterium sp. ZOR0034 TaxID=1339239 RepID=UPI0006490D95|nr:hypothetical protein [Cetobacterium sp. ZOR0034]